MNERFAKAEAVFHKALELPPAEREAFLQLSCGADADLHREVTALLRASGIAEDWLKEPSDEVILPGPITEGPGTVIGRYKLLEKIGEGGFGVVYMAEQEQPVRRRVAIKVIKLGMDTRQVVARFEAERQALALMDHPHIAKVLDAGATDAGRPYFVMELVRGVPITQFCEEQQLNTNERLELFIEVCSAIQHAHQKGIIHRDIKPTNVLVTLNEGVPHPMVIDFGVAKALNQRLTEHTLFTQFALMIGTPAYMSPEQAEMSKQDVDTRSDIYSLGILLYELLTGTTPFSQERLRGASYTEIQRIITEEEPERPSTRLTALRGAKGAREKRSSGEISGSQSHSKPEIQNPTCRAEAPHRRESEIEEDLDWMVMKCLEKDRTRRYETANDLGADLRRFLNNEPVVARPPSRLYRLQKLVRRNRLAFAAGAAVAAALMVGLGLSTWLFLRERAALKAAGEKAAESRRNLYAADMLITQAALENGHIGRAKELLEKYLPKPGEKDLRGWEWRYAWNQCRSDELFTLSGHKYGVNALAISTNGSILASGGNDTRVFVWDLKQGKNAGVLNLNAGWNVQGLAFSRDERELIVGTTDGRVTFWSCETWSPVTTLSNLSRVRSLRVSPDGRLLAVFGLTSVTLLNPADRQQLARLPLLGQGEYFPGGVAFSPDSSLLAYSRGNGEIMFWDTSHTNKVVPPLGGHQRYVTSLAFSPDGSILVSGSRDRTVRVWDMASRKELHKLDFRSFVIGLAFSPDGALLAVVGADQRIWLFETRSWEEVNVLKGHSHWVWPVVFTPDGKTLLTASYDNAIKCWPVLTNQEPVLQRFPEIRFVALLPGSKALYLRYSQTNAGYWGMDPLRELARFQLPPGHYSSSTSPDGKLWVVALTNHTVAMFDARQRLITNLALPTTSNDSHARFAFSTDSQLLAARGNDRTCRVWRIAADLTAVPAASQLAAFEMGTEKVWSLRFSESGRLLVIGYELGIVEIWNMATRQKRRLVTGDDSNIMGVAISRDESIVVTANGSGTGTAWDLRTGRLLARLRGEIGSLQSVAFSPDQTRVAACGGEGTVRIWDVETWQQVAAFKLHNERLSELGFTDDDALVAVVNDQFGGSRIFTLRAPKLLSSGRSEAP